MIRMPAQESCPPSAEPKHSTSHWKLRVRMRSGDCSVHLSGFTQGAEILPVQHEGILHLKGSSALLLGDRLTVEAWAESDDSRGEAMQPLISRWSIASQDGDLSAYDAGETSGLDTRGYLGAVFDGQYVYFVPQLNSTGLHANVLRYDTHRPFHANDGWQAYDAARTDGLNIRAYYGAAFDGRFVYFVPRRDDEGYHSRVLRYDTHEPFQSARGWAAFDVGLPISFQGAGADGRHIYFAPGYDTRFPNHSGHVLRFDTTAEFKDPASWQTFDASGTGGLLTACFDGAAFDGRRVLFAPLDNGCPLAYDTQGDFASPASWSAFDLRPFGIQRCVGSAFDGRYWYPVPYGPTRISARFDTRLPLNAREAWSFFDASAIGGLATAGYDGGAFDGRFVYYIPFWDGTQRTEGFHTHFLRFDTLSPFEDPASWHAWDASHIDGLDTVGYNAAAFDGRHLYLAPWHNGRSYLESGRIAGHGRVLRYDTTGDQAAFSLRWSDCGHNGGLCAAVPGPSFAINTSEGARGVQTHRIAPAGRHHLAGAYDGRELRLYVDGVLSARRACSGKMAGSGVDIALAGLTSGGAGFTGRLLDVRIQDANLDETTIRGHWKQGADAPQ